MRPAVCPMNTPRDPVAMPVSAPSMRRAGPWVLVTASAVALANFVQFSLVARVLGPDSAGEYALALAVVAPLTMLFGMSLRDLLQSKMRRWNDYRELLALRISLSLLLVASGLLVQVWLSVSPGLTALLAVARAGDLALDLMAGASLKAARPHLAAAPIIWNQVVGLLLFGASLAAWGNLSWSVSASALTSITVAILCARLGVPRLPGAGTRSPKFSHQLAWTRLGLPLGAAATITSLSALVPRALLEHESGLDAVGQYSAALAIASIPGIVFAAVAQAGLSPLVAARSASQGNPTRLVRRLFIVNLGIAAAFALPIFLFSGHLLGVLFGDAFAKPATELALQALAASTLIVACVWVADMVLVALQAYTARLTTTIATVGAVAVSAATLIPRYGLGGAVACTVVGYAVGLVAKLIVIQKKWSLSESP